jgi:hypothetical protein
MAGMKESRQKWPDGFEGRGGDHKDLYIEDDSMPSLEVGLGMKLNAMYDFHYSLVLCQS